MERPIIFMFSGIGSQYFHMGHNLFQRNATFNYWMQELDKIAVNLSGISVIKYIYDQEKKIGELFDHSIISCFSILMTEYSIFKVLYEYNIKPDFLLGTSLGEFLTATVSDVFTIEYAMSYVYAMMELVNSNCQDGQMIAVLANSDLFYKNTELNTKCELAAINFDTHFVISCQKEDKATIENYLRRNNIIYQIIPGNKSFHSSTLEAIKMNFYNLSVNQTNKSNFKKQRIPIISCASANVVSKIQPDHFWDVIRKQIRFQQTILTIEKTHYEPIYIDLGPSGTLSTFIKNILGKESRRRCFEILTPFGRDLNNLENIRTRLGGCPGT